MTVGTRAGGGRARPVLALATGIPVGCLGGLVGLGGGEFRLPLLVGLFGLEVRAAVPMNLVVSFVTLAAALLVRAHTLALAAVLPHLPEMIGLGLGGMMGAGWGAGLLVRLGERRLATVLALLLAGIGLLLIAEALLRDGGAAVMAADAPPRLLVGTLLGLAIGAVAALLGVAGGELLVPTLSLLFGADIRVAGTASLMISLVTLAAGLWRYGRLRALPTRRAIGAVALPMGLGSILGAAIGGVLAALASTALIKAVLGLVLIAAALKVVARPVPAGG
jgi:uncharacterized membrane protein YfcA